MPIVISYPGARYCRDQHDRIIEMILSRGFLWAIEVHSKDSSSARLGYYAHNCNLVQTHFNRINYGSSVNWQLEISLETAQDGRSTENS